MPCFHVSANKARDVDSLADWDKQVERMLESPQNSVTVYIDTKTIERSCKLASRSDESSGSESDGSNGIVSCVLLMLRVPFMTMSSDRKGS